MERDGLYSLTVVGAQLTDGLGSSSVILGARVMYPFIGATNYGPLPRGPGSGFISQFALTTGPAARIWG